jgi:hypothetical protein
MLAPGTSEVLPARALSATRTRLAFNNALPDSLKELDGNCVLQFQEVKIAC